MIRHIVLFNLHDGVTPEDPRVNLACAAEMALTAQFPQVNWAFGPNVSGRSTTPHFVGTGDFDSAATLAAFLADSRHQEAGRLWRQIADWLIADLELG